MLDSNLDAAHQESNINVYIMLTPRGSNRLGFEASDILKHVDITHSWQRVIKWRL